MDNLYSRYANAFLSIAIDENCVSLYKDALVEINAFLEANLEIKKYLESYFVIERSKYEIIDKICEPFELKNLSSMVKILIQKHRFHYFDKIVKEFVSLANEELNILEGFVYSTFELNKDQVHRLEDALSKNIGRKVELKPLIDNRLIGGIKIVINDHVYDGSLLGKLNSLKTNLKERSE